MDVSTILRGAAGNLTFWVFTGAVMGCISAWSLADSSWLSGEAPLFYELVLLIKSSFIQLLRMLIAPMIFFSLIGGLCNIGSVARLKTLGSMTVVYYLFTTGIAILIGLTSVFGLHPWTEYPGGLLAGGEQVIDVSNIAMVDVQEGSTMAVLGRLLSQAFVNPFTALMQLNIIGIVTNALLIGIAMVSILPADSPVFTLVDHINRVIARVLSWVIMVLPVGIYAIIFDFTLRLGANEGAGGELLKQLVAFAILAAGLTVLHGLFVLPGLVRLLSGMSAIDFIRKIARPMFVAFSTSSSAATLPVSKAAAEQELGVPEHVTSFVLPLGATMNMDGTALFEAIAVIFLAYVYGIELSNLAMVTVFLMTMIASIGAPGMPSASMAGMQIVLLSVGIPLEAIGLLLIVERPLDAIRTAINVEGDIAGSVIIARLIDRNS